MNGENVFHNLTIDEVVSELTSDSKDGLHSIESEKRLKEFGLNQLIKVQKTSWILILLRQFNNPMTYLLLIAAGLSFAFQDWVDAIAILSVILVTVFIGFWMEWKALQSMDSLRKMVITIAKVIRDGKTLEIPSDSIVPGDLILLEAGDLVPADSRLIELNQLQLNESALSGESLPVEKTIDPLPKETVVSDRKNMIYKGSFVSQGNGKAVVVGTGMNTELGMIAELVQTAKDSTTPLEKKIGVFSKKLILFTIIIVLAIFAVSLFNDQEWIETLKTSIALAVAAIPEGLPIVATLALAQGMIRMAKKNVVVKKLAAVETLGGTTVICSDKTGTLTQNKIEVSVVDFPSAWAELKHSVANETPIEESDLQNNENHQKLLEIGALCNTSEFYYSNGKEVAIGDPLETGLLKYVLKHKINIEELRRKNPKIKELPFNSDNKLMATMHSNPNGHWVAVKGAPETVINICKKISHNGKVHDFDKTEQNQWLERSTNLAKKGLRVLALAHKGCNEEDDFLTNLVFCGIVGFIDPPAIGVKEAIKECKKAGINVVMITGDHPSTALTIAKKLGIIAEKESHVVVGQDMPPYNELNQQIKNSWITTKVFARVSPAQKLDLVRVIQENNNIVGMTGDGMNDAPALKKSDIGIAMGIRGTQVAQDAAAMILKDDAFASIVSAIKQGRIIFDNIRKFVIYLLSCNLSEIIIVALIAFLNLPFQLLPIQILFLNLVTDVFPALALGFGKGDDLIMRTLPRSPNEPIITNKQWGTIWVYSGIIGLCTISAVYLNQYLFSSDLELNNNINNNLIFFTLSIAQMLHVFNMASTNISFYKNDVFRNKYVWMAMGICSLILVIVYHSPVMQNVLRLEFLSATHWLVIFVAAFSSLAINNILKRTKLIQ